jgi:hypothetical protein
MTCGDLGCPSADVVSGEGGVYCVDEEGVVEDVAAV